MVVKMESLPIEEVEVEAEAIVPMETVSSGSPTMLRPTEEFEAEAIVPMETVSSGSATMLRPIEKAEPEAPIPPEIVSSGSATTTTTTTTTTTVRLRRRAANRTEPLYLRRSTRPRQPPGYFESPPAPQDEDEDIPARKKRRLEEPFSGSTDEAARKTASPDVAMAPSPPAIDDIDDNDDADVNTESVTDTQPNAGATAFWTSEEDAKLTRAVANTPKKKWGKEYKTDWVAISALVPGRTRNQCRGRWKNALNPSIDQANGRTGAWSEDEDSELKDAVQTHGGKDWDAIAALVLGRTRGQCWSRWHTILDPSIDRASGRTGRWTAVEDTKLKDAVQMHSGKNWIAIAVLVPGRTKIQCMNRWHDVLDPNIGGASGRTGKWTEDEDSKLQDAVQTHGGKDWVAISALVPGRTRKQCYSRWQNDLYRRIGGASGRTGKWTEDEDSNLKDAVQTHGSKEWAEIAALLPGRTTKQCRQRWQEVLNPTTGRASGRKGKWTSVEDSKLKDAVQTHGDKGWSAISALILGRTEKQCGQRWRDALDPSIGGASGRTGKWTAVEDSKLKDAVQTHGDKGWSAISALIQGRTKKQCNNRWNSVLKPNIDGSSGRMGT
jgi:hypothetical protein